MAFIKPMKTLAPFVILFMLVGMLFWELYHSNPHDLPSALIGTNVPTFSVPGLYSDKFITQTNLKDKVLLLNVWASWCEACLEEHEMLMHIHNHYDVPIVGIVYKDKPENAKWWLNTYGNPYTEVGQDMSGEMAMDFGVYGTPETFVIRDGKIVYRHIGSLDQESWDNIIYPIIKERNKS